MTIEEIKAWIAADMPELQRRQRMYRYYQTKNDILQAPKKDDGKPDNRLAHGFTSYICNAYTGYMFGQPVTYSPLTDQPEAEGAGLLSADAGERDGEQLAEAVKQCYRYNDEEAENAALGLDCAICGTAVEILYVDQDAVTRFCRVDPVGVIAIRDQTIEENLQAVIRYYDRYNVATRETVRTVEVYDAQAVTTYRSTSGLLDDCVPEVRPHLFGDVPVVVYRNNLFGLGDAESVLSLIDAYDRMQSDGVNDQQYFTDAYLALTGIGDVDQEAYKQMRRNRLLLLPEGASANWLIKQQSDVTPQNIKDRLKTDIHQLSACPDMSDENFAGNASGVALKYKLLQFENVAGIKEREFKRGLQRRLELLCNIWRLKGLPAYDWRSVKIEFHRALPENLLEMSQVMGNLSDILSDETKRAILPLDIDEATEKERLESERGGSMFTPQERKTGYLDDPQPPEEAVGAFGDVKANGGE